MNQNNERASALSEKTIVVTGASRGLGRAVAIEFAARGANVLGVGRDESALQETAHLAGQASLPQHSMCATRRQSRSTSRPCLRSMC
jgi:NAD(P)-dependent dehydrogenase (short-subunit alcohol dehydrogenase family)